jgi:hypothetical protein
MGTLSRADSFVFIGGDLFGINLGIFFGGTDWVVL